jgi:hypothetical protein
MPLFYRAMRVFLTISHFYLDGFRRMTLGKTLWALILIKLFVIFAILKVFFFPNDLGSRFDTPGQKSDYVATRLTSVVSATGPLPPSTKTHPPKLNNKP